jgi:hypothetical protein
MSKQRFVKEINRLTCDINQMVEIYPTVAKAGGLQSQDVKGDAVVGYCEFLTTQDLKSSGFPRCF